MVLLLYIFPGFFLSLIVVKLLRKIASKYHIGSLPSPRKIHHKFIPLLGGLGFTTGIISVVLFAQIVGQLSWMAWYNFLPFWIGLAIIILTGIIDDIAGLNAIHKFVGESLSAVCLILGGSGIQSLSTPMGDVLFLGVFSVPFTFLWILIIINAVNFLDGLDGLAAGVCLIITIGFLFIIQKNSAIFLSIISIGLIAGILGFLKYNFFPAKIFMGDTGSLQLGYLIAFLSIDSLKIAGSHQIYFLTSLVLLGLPLTDTMLSFLRRLGEGKNPFFADMEHIHHRLLHLGLNHSQTVWILYLITIFYVILGVLMVFYRGTSALILFLVAAILSFYWIWRLGYIETRFSMQYIMNQFNKSIPVKKRAPLFFSRIWHKLLIIFSDLIMVNLALYLMYWFKFRSGIVEATVHISFSEYFSSPVFLFFTLGWTFLFWINNLYQMDWDVSRFDKFLRVSKVVTFGIILLGFLTYDFETSINREQIISLAFYWITILVLVNGGRLFLIFLEKKYSLFTYYPKNTLIIGCNRNAKKILDDIEINPHLIFNVVGFISKKITRNQFHGFPVLGSYKDLPQIIHQHKIDEVIIALPDNSTPEFIEILGLCEPQEVKIKIPPATHDIYSGHRKDLMSHAYLQIFPQNMVLWQWILKRIFDLIFSVTSILLVSPLFVAVAIYNKIKYRKSVFIKIPILGKNGIAFKMYVFRLNETEYDFEQNPIYLGTSKENQTYNLFSHFLLKYRLYKLPQLLNVVLGDMSLIGPRAEPYEWYIKYQEFLPFVYHRIYVRPGITGLAQIKYHYEISQKVLKEMLKYDIYYVNNMSLRLDFRILLLTLFLFLRKTNNKKLNLPKDDDPSIEQIPSESNISMKTGKFV
jgi:UDP-GlcNAc:undecaprenyl-phosphate GlcNAc-1-phosphate transferase